MAIAGLPSGTGPKDRFGCDRKAGYSRTVAFAPWFGLAHGEGHSRRIAVSVEVIPRS